VLPWLRRHHVLRQRDDGLQSNVNTAAPRHEARDDDGMEPDFIARLRTQLGGPRDGALLRFSLGNALLGQGDAAGAAVALRAALEFDACYSAAWKLLGRALAESGDSSGAIAAFERGIDVARTRGDEQAAKEMSVFLRRLRQPAAP
jgi:predicted Zn-dependent protease